MQGQPPIQYIQQSPPPVQYIQLQPPQVQYIQMPPPFPMFQPYAQLQPFPMAQQPFRQGPAL